MVSEKGDGVREVIILNCGFQFVSLFALISLLGSRPLLRTLFLAFMKSKQLVRGEWR